GPGWLRQNVVIELQIRSLRGQDGCMLSEPKQMCAEFQRHFADLYGARGGQEAEVNFTSYLDGMPRLSARDVEFCEMPITAKDIREALTSCTRERSPGLDGLPFELYIYMPDLFGELLRDVYCNWQQNGEYPNL
ncbi:hypothetical protein, partial [Escherichia coli]|uniref:hypothetical protein n=1 Tax=Escherichia coli TaxID=562 RepID=UPI00321B78B0